MTKNLKFIFWLLVNSCHANNAWHIYHISIIQKEKLNQNHRNNIFVILQLKKKIIEKC